MNQSNPNYLQTLTQALTLAELYDFHHSRHLGDLGFWLYFAGKYRSPILELGCGTGRLLIPIARAGYKVFGLDRNSAMLRVLKKKLRSDQAGRIEIIQADLTAFSLAKLFSLIILPCNTYSTLSADERSQCLYRVRQHLASGGAFVASMPNPGRLASLPEHSDPELEEVFQDPETGDSIQISSAWERGEGRFRLSWYYDRLSADGLVQRLVVETIHRLNDPEIYLHELSASGLDPIGSYGDFDRSAYGFDSPYLIITAKR